MLSIAPDIDTSPGDVACYRWPGWPYLSIACWQCGVPRLVHAARRKERDLALDRSCLTCRWRSMNNEEPDSVVVDRLVAGNYDAARANRRERQAAVEILTRRGYGAILIGQMTGMTPRAVVRIRGRIRAETATRTESAAA